MLKKLLLCGTIAVLFSACSRKTIDVEKPVDPVVVAPPTPYKIVEDFETGTKTAFAAADVTTLTGSWNMDNALIATSATDPKNGLKSIRIRSTGKLTMNYDIQGLQTLYISHAKFNEDKPSVWQLFVSTDGGITYAQLGKDILENSTTLVLDSFKVTTTAKVRFQIKNVGPATGLRINIDDITFKGTGDPGIVVGKPDTDTPDIPTGTPAPTRGITAGPDAQPSSGDNSNLLFGNPSNASMATPDDLLLDQKYYIESYNSTRSIPNWVSWHLDASSLGSVDRSDTFAGFNGLPEGTYVVQSNSYQGSITGFDRGHNCPSGDRTSSTDANNSTFLMTNMIPQAPKNNQGPWAKLEGFLRTLVAAQNEVYIVMGSYGTGGVGAVGSASTIANGKITVPANVWKVAVIIPKGDGDLNRVTSSTRVIAVNTPNNNTIDADWKKYIVTVRDIEKATGYNLLSNLPQNIQDAIETKKDTGN